MGILKLSDTWKIDGKPIYTPCIDVDIDWDSLSAEGSGRTNDGIMHIEWIRKEIWKVSITYTIMTREEKAYMDRLIANRECKFTFFHTTGMKTIDAYISNGKSKLHSGVLYDGLYTNVTYHFIEK